MGLCLSLGASSAATLPESHEPEAGAALDQHGASDQKPPAPVKPEAEPRAQGIRLALLVGVDVLAWAGYSYDTRVSLPDGQQLRYGGKAGAPGVALSGGGAVTLPGAFRRITAGVHISAGGLNSSKRPVIPAGVSTPFSQINLQNQIRSKYSYAPGWTSALSLYIDHDLAFLHENRVRAGYQYWRQTGSYTGTFEPTDKSHALAGYDVRLATRSHLLRVSVNNYASLDDSDNGTTAPNRPRRKTGMIWQWGVAVGTNRTILIFAAIGPCWELAR